MAPRPKCDGFFDDCFPHRNSHQDGRPARPYESRIAVLSLAAEVLIMPRFPLLVCAIATLVTAALPAGAAEKIVLVAGTGGDGSLALKGKLDGPFGVAFDKGGTMYIVEMTGQRVLKIDDKGTLNVLAGTGKKGNAGDRGPASEAEFNGPHSLAVGPDGIVYIADTWNNRVRAIDPKTGVIRSFAGTGDKGFAGDGGPASEAKFGGVYCVAFDPPGKQMYLADLDNRRIRAIDMKTGTVRTVAGNGEKGVPEDGTEAVRAPLVDPRAVAADGAGNVYILERSGHALRVVDDKGRIRTVAGTGKVGASGDGGEARKATLNGPKHLCIDGDGNVFIADTENHLIRKYLPKEGKIVRVAGSGQKGNGGLGGPPEKAELSQPHGVTIHKDGTLYISDSSNNRVLKIER
jgi:DNA-binding beta-propeller fold protein YncE